MFSKLHHRLGTAGFIIAIVALVAALGGGAYAASGGLTGKQKQEVKKIAKHYAGKPGPRGKRGKNGQNGQNGANGAAGAKGDKGDRGATGAPGLPGGTGANGKSVVLGAAPGSECPEGGISVGVEGSASVSYACNGLEGPPGSPWTAGGTLPSEQTETGTWAVNLVAGESKQFPISFTLPLATAPEPILVEGASATGCPGVVEGLPTAESGKLCVYQVKLTTGVAGEETGFLKPYGTPAPGAGPAGAIFGFECETGACIRYGSWAVTAE